MLIDHKCSKCGLEQLVKLEQQYVNTRGIKSSKIYRDYNGRRLVGNQCHPCRNQQIRFHNNKRDRRDSSNPRIKKELWAVDKAKKLMEDNGFKVDEGHGRGPDLYCHLGKSAVGPALTMNVEVKAVCKNKNTNGWNIGPIKKCRRNDDLLIIVLPNGFAYPIVMSEYINAKPRSEIRSITSVVHKFGASQI